MLSVNFSMLSKSWIFLHFLNTDKLKHLANLENRKKQTIVRSKKNKFIPFQFQAYILIIIYSISNLIIE